MAVIKFQNSSSFKLATFFTVLLAVSVAVVVYLIVIANDEDIKRQVESQINADIQIFNELEILGGKQAIEKIIDERLKNNSSEYFYKSQIEKISNVKTLKEGLIQFPYQDSQILAKIHTFSNGKWLIIGRNIDNIESTQTIISQLGIVIIFAMSIVVLVGYLVGKYVVNLINKISNTADDIMKSGDLSRRIPVTHHRDDLSKLAHVLNIMFARLEESVAAVRQVSDNIAHDLRTPLSRLRNRLVDFNGGKKAKAELINEADNLIKIFNALLRIARIESGKEIGKEGAKFNKLNLKLLIQDVVELYEPVAEEKNLHLKTSLSETQIRGDRDLLFQAMVNLLDNAIKFSPEFGEVKLSLKPSAQGAIIEIADSGVGISKAEREKVFNRFYRAENSRSKAGHGLGLSLVKAVIDAHSGTIKLADNKTGLKVVVTIPSALIA